MRLFINSQRTGTSAATLDSNSINFQIKFTSSFKSQNQGCSCYMIDRLHYDSKIFCNIFVGVVWSNFRILLLAHLHAGNWAIQITLPRQDQDPMVCTDPSPLNMIGVFSITFNYVHKYIGYTICVPTLVQWSQLLLSDFLQI